MGRTNEQASETCRTCGGIGEVPEFSFLDRVWLSQPCPANCASGMVPRCD